MVGAGASVARGAGLGWIVAGLLLHAVSSKAGTMTIKTKCLILYLLIRVGVGTGIRPGNSVVKMPKHHKITMIRCGLYGVKKMNRTP